MISIRPNRGDCKVKKKKLHKMFNNNCILKIHKFFLRFVLLFETRIRYKDTPIITNKIDQTTGNSQLGGKKAGFTKFGYQDFIEKELKKAPINPAT